MPLRIRFTFALLFMSAMLHAQTYEYSLRWDNPKTHLFEVSLVTEKAEGSNTVFQIPAWRPGRYYIQDYAAAVTGFIALDDKGNPLHWEKVSNHAWEVRNPGEGKIHVRYRYYANKMDAGSSMLDQGMAYFNPSNMFMHVQDRYESPCTLKVPELPDGWKAATALKKDGPKSFYADSYHEFVDAPTILSPTLKTLHSRIAGVDFYFHFQGSFPNDKATEDAFQANLDKIIREQGGIFGGFPFKAYHFIYHLVPFNIFHAVEHANSSCFALPASMAVSPEAIAKLNSISAHEFFHLWNVKRIRPAVMWPYDYQKEAYTRLHWFTEGVTDYYAELTLARAGLVRRDEFFSVLAGTLEYLENSYAATAVSCEQASFNSWLDRSDYLIPYHQISYYTLGMRSGLLLDLAIRARTMGEKSLDDLFRNLLRDYYLAGKGLEENAIQQSVEQLIGKSFGDFFQKYVAGVDKVNYADFLEPFGLELLMEDRPEASWEKVGIEKFLQHSHGLVVSRVRPNSDAERAGLAVGDTVIQVNDLPHEKFDAKAYFRTFRNPAEMALLISNAGGQHPIRLTWTGSFSPKFLRIFPAEKSSKTQQGLLDTWLKSQALSE